MKITFGKAGLDKTWQRKFPETTECCRCKKEARIAFVAHEAIDEDDRKEGKRKEGIERLCDMYRNHDDGKLWLHDCCAVAVYLCTGCLEPTSLYNQG